MTYGLRILHVTDFFAPTAGGVERVCAGLCGELAARGCKIEVLAPESQEAGDLPVPEGIEVHRFRVSHKNTPAHYRSVFVQGRKAFDAVVSRRVPDLIHSHLTLSTLPVLSPARRLGIPIVATFYGPWFWEYRFQARRLSRNDPVRRLAVEVISPFIAACMRKAQETVLDRARSVVVLSRHSVGELSMLGWRPSRGALEVIPGGIDPGAFKPERSRNTLRKTLGVPDDSALLFSVRRLVPRMGLENLIRAAALLKGQGRNCRLVIGGDGPLCGPLESLADKLGIADCVSLVGRIPDGDLPGYYSASDLLVMPTVALEGFGLPVVEAWACGLPAVGTPVAGVGELISRSGPELVAASVRPEDLAYVIDKALSRDQESLSRACLKLSETFQWPVLAERYLRLYHRVLKGTIPASNRLDGMEP